MFKDTTPTPMVPVLYSIALNRHFRISSKEGQTPDHLRFKRCAARQTGNNPSACHSGTTDFPTDWTSGRRHVSADSPGHLVMLVQLGAFPGKPKHKRNVHSAFLAPKFQTDDWEQSITLINTRRLLTAYLR
jgi:hypothetical protein